MCVSLVPGARIASMDSDSQVSVGNSRALATNPPELEQKRTTHECIANHLGHYMPPRERFMYHGSIESPPARLWLVIPLHTAIRATKNGRTGKEYKPRARYLVGWIDLKKIVCRGYGQIRVARVVLWTARTSQGVSQSETQITDRHVYLQVRRTG